MASKGHIVMFPYPLQGHVIPFVNLAIRLASTGFTVTFVNTQSVHQHISNATHAPPPAHDIFAHSGLDIRYQTIWDGFPLTFDRSLHHDQFFESILAEFPSHVDHMLRDLTRRDPTVNALIVDTFYVWGSFIADKYNLVNISFFTEPALVFSLYYHWDLLRDNGHFATAKENRVEAIEYIPGVKGIMASDLASYLQSEDEACTVVHRIIYRAFKDVKKADLIVCNTIEELEQGTITALHKKQPFYAIGPIFAPGFSKTCIPTSLWSESNCTQWLHSKPPGSVLYVSFGSYAHTTKQVLEEIANGLLLSNVNFIWVLRPDIVSSDDIDILPVGFEEQINGQGLVVKWCSQIEVISHQAIGGFLTHCGWNSILESIWCGVPLICYPLLTDQFSNRKLVVDDFKIGINLCDEGSIVTREGVEKKIKYLMGKESKTMREELKKVKKTMEGAMGINGSSQVNYNKFVKELENKLDDKRGFVANTIDSC